MLQITGIVAAAPSGEAETARPCLTTTGAAPAVGREIVLQASGGRTSPCDVVRPASDPRARQLGGQRFAQRVGTVDQMRARVVVHAATCTPLACQRRVDALQQQVRLPAHRAARVGARTGCGPQHGKGQTIDMVALQLAARCRHAGATGQLGPQFTRQSRMDLAQ